MKPLRRSFLWTTGTGRLFLTFWFLTVVIIVGRVVFDVQSYYFGSSIVVPGRSCRYLIRLPRGFCEWEKPRPLLIYLHGSGELKKTVRSLRGADAVSFMGGKISPDEFPFIVVSPKSDTDPWNPDRIVELLDELLDDGESRWAIDPSRVYLTGFSMGGFGTWETGMRYPDRFAAIVPIAGGYREYDPEGMKNLPVWAFHGEHDETVHPSYSIDMLESLHEQRGISDETRLTIFHDRGHDIPTTVYRNHDLYRWLLKYRINK